MTPAAAQAGNLRLFFLYALYLLPDQSRDSAQGMSPVRTDRRYRRKLRWPSRMDWAHWSLGWRGTDESGGRSSPGWGN